MVDDNDDEMKKQFGFIRGALNNIRNKEGDRTGVAGDITCPKCQGRLHYTIASTNGHIWGRCEKPNCLQWMQ